LSSKAEASNAHHILPYSAQIEVLSWPKLY